MSDLPEAPSRRELLKQGAAAAAVCMIVPRFVLGGRGYTAPSDQLVVAGVGVSGKGESDLVSFAKTGGRPHRLSLRCGRPPRRPRGVGVSAGEILQGLAAAAGQRREEFRCRLGVCARPQPRRYHPGGHAAGQARLRAEAAYPRHLRSPRPHRSRQALQGGDPDGQPGRVRRRRAPAPGMV